GHDVSGVRRTDIGRVISRRPIRQDSARSGGRARRRRRSAELPTIPNLDNSSPPRSVKAAMTSSTGDLRLAIRGLRRSPLFAIVATLSLALGIGANTAIFTLMDQILLRRLPVKDPDRLVMLYQQGSHNGSNMGTRMHSYPVYQDLQQRAEPFAEVLCRRLAPASVSIDNQTERVNAELVSGNYFSMLGVKPVIGRVFSSEEDDRVYGGHPVVVLSYDYWVRRFAGDPNVIGKKVFVNDYPMNILRASSS